MRLRALGCVAVLAACDGGPTQPSQIAGPPDAPRFEILDMATILKDPSVQEAATGHAVHVGEGRLRNPQNYSFSAVRHLDGDVSGEFELTHENLSGVDETAHGTVLCLTVDRNTATIGAVVDNGSAIFREGSTVVWQVVDIGESVDEPDLASPIVLAPVTKGECVTKVPADVEEVRQGDIQVHQIGQ